ncbi:nucleotidyl transferase AbiEii/AbiGii toxin family protein [candidate division WOR-3 bacterium]|nr:nucleotidyl transferase AbiEii/AbiGii toxin family protein [candidate division WOR-3 bacterium]
MNREKLKDIIPALARKYKFRPAIVEKDYYLTIILNNIETGLSDKLVLKGGTLLNKIYFSYRRLSEDLDFVYSGGRILTSRSARSKAITPIREMMPRFLELLDLRSKNPMGEGFNNSTQYFFDISYPSFLQERRKV